MHGGCWSDDGEGFWYSVRHRLKESFSIVIFTVGLTLVYALYQSNVGTAYRHRAQLYVFFFIFISIGLELRRKARLEKHLRIPVVPASLNPVPAQAGPGLLVRGTINPKTS